MLLQCQLVQAMNLFRLPSSAPHQKRAVHCPGDLQTILAEDGSQRYLVSHKSAGHNGILRRIVADSQRGDCLERHGGEKRRMLDGKAWLRMNAKVGRQSLEYPLRGSNSRIRTCSTVSDYEISSSMFSHHPTRLGYAANPEFCGLRMGGAIGGASCNNLETTLADNRITP